MENTIRLSKVTKIIGIVTAVIFSLIVVAMLITGNIGAAICFTPFVILGLALILAYKKQTIAIAEDELVFSYLIKKKQHIKYKDISCILIIPLNNRTQTALIDRSYNRIITLDIMLDNYELLYSALREHGIEAIDFGELVRQGKNVSKYSTALNWIERNYYRNIYNEEEIVSNLVNSREKGDIKKTKQLLKLLGWIFIAADVFAFFAGGRSMITIFILVLLATYALYVKYYPYIFIEVTTKNGQEQAYQLPFMGAAIALLFSISLGKYYNYEFGSYMKSTAVITLLLAAPFIIKSSRIDVVQRISRVMSVIFAAFILAFTLTFPINFLLTFEKSAHEKVIVVDKKISGGKTRDCDLYVNYNGEKESFTVSAREYNNTSVGDVKRICRRKSLLGLEYSTLHD